MLGLCTKSLERKTSTSLAAFVSDQKSAEIFSTGQAWARLTRAVSGKQEKQLVSDWENKRDISDNNNLNNNSGKKFGKQRVELKSQEEELRL